MNTLLAQLILVAEGEDLGKWTNILFVIVLAVIWLVGSIVKATAKKPEGEEKKQGQPSRKPGGKLREVAERIERELSQLTRDRVGEPSEQAKGPQRELSRKPGQVRPAGLGAVASRECRRLHLLAGGAGRSHARPPAAKTGPPGALRAGRGPRPGTPHRRVGRGAAAVPGVACVDARRGVTPIGLLSA